MLALKRIFSSFTAPELTRINTVIQNINIKKDTIITEDAIIGSKRSNLIIFAVKNILWVYPFTKKISVPIVVGNRAGILTETRLYLSISGKDGKRTIIRIYKSDAFKPILKTIKKYSQLLYSLNTTPNILSASDYFEENNTAYRVTDYINSYSLTNYVTYYNNLDDTTILNICFSLLDALWVIHCRNLTYGNVCPSTIYICDNNCIKLYLDETIPTQIISAKSLHLTPGFASPELCKNHESFILKPQMDIYSFGALMYYITTGIVPAPATSKGSNGTVIDTGSLNIRHLFFPKFLVSLSDCFFICSP